ncbi:hypothetical protein AV530_004565 [Patagioenas fasciata monilis]|uniref:Uncharacterized protein n=1 Tax=Patagioenas fasciata monilis TaxID=372326 RepID=A0A1V4KHG8_PATFA|nr:hypothetical protein AV530_004565 [Patagioenas fasciata monilis]
MKEPRAARDEIEKDDSCCLEAAPHQLHAELHRSCTRGCTTGIRAWDPPGSQRLIPVCAPRLSLSTPRALPGALLLETSIRLTAGLTARPFRCWITPHT